MELWKVYILQCADDTLYTGITTDIERRVQEHNSSPQGAKYTKTRRPVKLVYFRECKNRAEASKKEYEIKQLSRAKKIELISNSL